jgi:hypothetical protein
MSLFPQEDILMKEIDSWKGFLTCFNGGEALSFILYQCRYGRGHTSSSLEELVLMVVLVILVINSLVA